jgi:hypothetical protein
MSIFEILAEYGRTKPQGSIETGLPEAEGGSVGTVVARAVGALLAIGLAVHAVVREAQGPFGSLVPSGLLAAYLLASAFVSPKPETGNLGIAGGLFDHPLRFSDDINRTLLLLAVLLAPGKWAIGALIEGVQLARGRRIIVQRQVVFPRRGARPQRQATPDERRGR